MPIKDKEIRKEYMKDYRKQILKNNPGYYKIDYKNRIKYLKKWKKDNSDKMKTYREKWNKENPGYQKKYQKEYERKCARKEYSKQYRKDNIEKIKDYQKQYCRNKRKTDLKYNLNYKISRAIRKSLKGNKAGRHWEDLIGYTLNDLIRRLKKTMPKNYNWNDYMEGKLEIDHIYPISIFNFTKATDYDFQRCWALKNLQLLPARENWKKSNKLQKPFQPSLKITLFLPKKVHSYRQKGARTLPFIHSIYLS